MTWRTKFVDYDARRNPRTDRHCCMCQRDLRPGQAHRHVYLLADLLALHPGDFDKREPLASDLGWHLMGMDCARKFGMDWTAGHAGFGPTSPVAPSHDP